MKTMCAEFINYNMKTKFNTKLTARHELIRHLNLMIGIGTIIGILFLISLIALVIYCGKEIIL